MRQVRILYSIASKCVRTLSASLLCRGTSAEHPAGADFSLDGIIAFDVVRTERTPSSKPVCSSAEPCSCSPPSPVTVSYTHLDVYKRQAMTKPDFCASSRNGLKATSCPALWWKQSPFPERSTAKYSAFRSKKLSPKKASNPATASARNSAYGCTQSSPRPSFAESFFCCPLPLPSAAFHTLQFAALYPIIKYIGKNAMQKQRKA